MDELERTFLEEYAGAASELAQGRFKNAAILLSKALFALCDLTIYLKLHKLPKNHSERFAILRDKFHDIYLLVDGVFGHYTAAYSKPVLKETCGVIKDAIKNIAGSNVLPEKIKKIVEQ